METELKLGPPGESPETEEKKTKKKEKAKRRDQLSSPARRDYKVVGWPPVCSYRQRTSSPKKIYVKVSMDGAPFLRKLELTSCSGYSSLYSTVHALFDLGGLAAKEYSLIYEDDDGDWMLVGDVPWRMFASTCKRLRGMKKTTRS